MHDPKGPVCRIIHVQIIGLSYHSICQLLSVSRIKVLKNLAAHDSTCWFLEGPYQAVFVPGDVGTLSTGNTDF